MPGEARYDETKEKVEGLAREVVKGDTDRTTNIEQLKQTLEQKARFPTHSEIMDVYKAGDSRTRFSTAVMIAENGMSRAGATTLDLAHRVEGKGPVIFGQGKLGVPDVYYKRIGNSDEFLVVTRMNNSEKAEENTVVLMVAKQKDGKPLIGEGYPNQLNYVTTQKGYENVVSRKREHPNAETPSKNLRELMEGKKTCDEYLVGFRKENYGNDLHQYWRNWDKEKANDPDHWKSNRFKGELIHRIEGDYQELLQNFRMSIENVIEKTRRTREEAEEKRKQDSEGPAFDIIMRKNPELFNKVMERRSRLRGGVGEKTAERAEADPEPISHTLKQEDKPPVETRNSADKKTPEKPEKVIEATKKIPEKPEADPKEKEFFENSQGKIDQIKKLQEKAQKGKLWTESGISTPDSRKFEDELEAFAQAAKNIGITFEKNEDLLTIGAKYRIDPKVFFEGNQTRIAELRALQKEALSSKLWTESGGDISTPDSRKYTTEMETFAQAAKAKGIKFRKAEDLLA